MMIGFVLYGERKEKGGWRWMDSWRDGGMDGGMEGGVEEGGRGREKEGSRKKRKMVGI